MTTADKLKPHNIEAEQALLGSILIDDGVFYQIEPLHLTGSDFFIVKNGWVFEAMQALYQANEPIDLITLSEKLDQTKRLDEIGGGAYLTSLMNVTPTAIHGPYYARIITNCADRRRFIDEGANLVKLAYDETGDIEQVITQAQNIIPNALNGRGSLLVNSNGSNWEKMASVIGPIDWAWPDWLPKGLLSMIVSESGAGKSAIALRIAACFLSGESWPDNEIFFDDTGCVLWCEAEAAQAVNLNRAKEWGLPIQKILTPLGDPLMDIELDNPDHKAALVSMAQRDDVKFIVIDSLSGSTHKDAGKANDMLLTCKMLAELARNTGKPILLTHHLRKRGVLDSIEKITLDRVRDSSAIVQLARVIWALDTPNPDDIDNKRLSVIKNNLARFAEPIGLRVSDAGITFGDAPEPPRNETLQDRAADLLLSLLANGPVPAAKLQKEVELAGLSWHTAKKAKDSLGIVSTKPGNVWHWSLPAKEGA